MCIIDCLSTIVFILPLHLDYTKVIILILWWRNFQLEYWRTFQLVSTLYSQDGKGKEAVCRAVFALGSVRWFILEGNREDDDMILFGIVVGLMEDEYGYVSLNELSDVELDLSAQGLCKLQVRQQQNFKPVPLKQIQDSRLQDFLARFE